MENIARIEDKIDKTVAGNTPISMQLGGIHFSTMMEIFEMAKLMAISRTAVPKHLRENPGACLAVCIQALEWRMSPFSVANKSYEVNDRIAYESQLIVAVINARAPLKERLRYVYDGEGVDMKCTVSGLIKGEATALPYESPQIKNIKVKNSPLWTSDPKQQLGYYSARAWARRHCPETILGIYAEDELRDAEDIARGATDVTPQVGKRLSGQKGRGFSQEGVDRALEHKPSETLDASQKAEPVLVPVETAPEQPATTGPAEPQLALPGDIEAEIEAKKTAVLACTTKADLKALQENVTAYLKANKRLDLRNDFLKVVSEREKKLEA